MDHGDQVIFRLLERRFDLPRQHRLPPGNFNLIRLLAIGDCHVIPALRERAVDAGEHALIGQVANSRFLRAAARVGHDENAILGVKDLAQLIPRPLEDGFEILAAVRQHGLGLLFQDFRGHIHRPRNEHW